MNLLRYKGYTGQVEVDAEAGVLFGRVLDIRDVITFEGETVADIMAAFHDSVNDYLAFCDEQGKEPDKPYSGKLAFRTTPDRHRKIALAAAGAGKSVNAWMDDTVAEAAERALHGVGAGEGKDQGE
jgi:predicted HicB family RNase H-like nuclease